MSTHNAPGAGGSEGELIADYVVLRRSDVEALMEEWGDLDQDPFWNPVEFGVTPEAKSALVAALHKVFMSSRHASGPGLPALVDGVIAAGWRPARTDGSACEDGSESANGS